MASGDAGCIAVLVSEMPVAGSSSPADDPDFSIVCRRADSLGARSRWLVFAWLCVVSFGMAIVFAALGAWLVMPYSIIEMGAVYWAFRWYEQRTADWEQLTVHGDSVVVESVRGGVRTRQQFNRPWARVELDDGKFGQSPSLGLRYAGQLVQFGSDLPVTDRVRLARDLRRLLGRPPQAAHMGNR
jgi:uncharacterized membrane protein